MKPSATVKKAYRLARQALKKAHAPYSQFRVGAAVVSGTCCFSGCNVENASYGATVCAERVATFKAVSEGVRRFSDVVVVTPLSQPVAPCGLCLQVLREFCDETTRVWIGNHLKIQQVMTLAELYPLSFGPTELRRSRKK